MVKSSTSHLLAYKFSIFLLAIIIASSMTPVATAVSIKGPASEEVVLTPVEADPSTVIDSLGASIDVSMHQFRYQDIEALIGGRDDIKEALVKYYTYDILLNPAPVYWSYYEGNLTREEIAALEGVPVEAVTYVYYNETSGETYAEFGAYPGRGINPFAFQSVRYAVNFLVNREWVYRDLLHGYGEPKYLFIGLKDPMMYYLLDIYLENRFPYSVYLADNYTTTALQAVGAEKIDDKWYYDGNPINIIFYIRIEDERRDLGDRVADLLENLGFNVTRTYVNAGTAFNNVYRSDPRDHLWYLYTEGWAEGIAAIPDIYKIAFFGSSKYGPLPAWGSGLWEYRNETIEDLIDQIHNGEYSDFEEYLAKYRLATEMIIQDSIRVWIADLYKVNLYEDYVENTVKGYGGLLNPLSIRSMNNTLTGTLRIGYPSSYGETVYNPYSWPDTFMSTTVHIIFFDPLVIADPITGEYRPFRASYEVEAPSETPSVPIPSGTVIWDASDNEWVPVGMGALSKSVVKFNLSRLIGSHWHNGMNITWADVIATWAYIWEITEDTVKSGLEYQHYRDIIDNIVGLRFDTDNNVLEVYTNYYSKLNPDEIAYLVSIIAPETPLEIWEAMSYLAFNESSYALTYSRASNEEIPWLNLLDPVHAGDIGDLLDSFYDNATVYNEISKYTTVASTNYLSYEEFLERINASRDWINTHHDAVISNGPFYVDSVSDAIDLTAFRDPAYPFTPSDFYMEVLQANITNIDIDPVTIGEPAQVNVFVEGPDPLTVKYGVKVVGTMQVLALGDAVHVEPGHYIIDIPGSLTSTMDDNTLYELVVVAFSKDNNTYDVQVAPLPVGPSAYTEDTVEGGSTETITANTSTANVSVEVEATDNVSVYVSVFENTEPVPDVGGPGGAEYTGYAVDVYVNDTDAVNWPIYIEVEYDESALPPDVAEESLAIYYYNETTHSWKKCSDTGVDAAANKVWAYITREEYEAGIGNIFGILGIPPAVGGKLVIYHASSREPVPASLLIIGLASIGVLYVALTKKHHSVKK